MLNKGVELRWQQRFRIVAGLLILGRLTAASVQQVAVPGPSRTESPASTLWSHDVRRSLKTVLGGSAPHSGVQLTDQAAAWESLQHRSNQRIGAEFKAVVARKQQRRLHGSDQVEPDGGDMLLDIPGDPTAGEVVLQPMDTWFLQPLGLDPFGLSSRTRTVDNVRTAFSARGSATLNINVVFEALAAFNTSMRLPPLPRTFYLTIENENREKITCGRGSVYRDQTVQCTGLLPGRYTVTAFDSDVSDLELADKANVNVEDGSNDEQLLIQLGMLLLEASFGSLAWPGVYARNRITPFGAVIHAQIVGAQIVVYSKTKPDQIWDMQWTGDEGTAPFFLVPGSGDFIANMSVGDTLLATQPVQFVPDANYLNSLSLTQQPQLTQLVAQQQLLCTGEVEDVRGESGSFPADIRQLEANGQKVYHPRGFFCRWELVPDFPELTLTVSYSGLLDDESLVLYLGPNNIIKLTKPGDQDVGGVFQATIWVDRSILIEFQTTKSSTSEVGAFTVNWTSNSPSTKGLLTSRTMVVVLGCVSAAGAVLAAMCFYCVCCSRRRRGVVIVNGETGTTQRVSLLRVPSAVRELLPVKPYQPPEENPLPGASTEPDCCSICLIEFEPAENVTVLPCMHFYHKECIGSWLKRNCTCPLCKSNVLQAFHNTQDAQQQQQQRRHRRRHRRHSERNRASSNSDAGDPQAAPDSSTAAADSEGDAVVNVIALAGAIPSISGSEPLNRLPPLPTQRPSAGAPAAAAAVQGGQDGARILRTPSPALSLSNLPNGTVAVEASDFAAAAAAAAAALASEQQPAAAAADPARSPQAGGAGALSGAYEAAQASVSALRGSSRVWGRSIRGLLRTSSGGIAAEPTAVVATSADGQYAVEMGPVPNGPMAAAATGRESSRAATRSPEIVMHVPSRGAISIYAYAGHPHSTEQEMSDDVHGPAQQQQQQLRSSSTSPAAYVPGAVLSSSMVESRRPPSRNTASLPDVTG